MDTSATLRPPPPEARGRSHGGDPLWSKTNPVHIREPQSERGACLLPRSRFFSAHRTGQRTAPAVVQGTHPWQKQPRYHSHSRPSSLSAAPETQRGHPALQREDRTCERGPDPRVLCMGQHLSLGLVQCPGGGYQPKPQQDTPNFQPASARGWGLGSLAPELMGSRESTLHTPRDLLPASWPWALALPGSLQPVGSKCPAWREMSQEGMGGGRPQPERRLKLAFWQSNMSVMPRASSGPRRSTSLSRENLQRRKGQ